jgi:peroxiredoxin
MGIEVIGISRDLAPSQQEFKTKVGAKNHFLSDPDLTVTRRYGAVRDDLGVDVANRYYFLIDKDGALIWKDVTGRLIPVEDLLNRLSQID